MTTKDEFKRALDQHPMVRHSCNGPMTAMSGSMACEFLDKYWPVIDKSLSILSGTDPDWCVVRREPSNAMLKEGAGVNNERDGDDVSWVYKAMLTASEKERE